MECKFEKCVCEKEVDWTVNAPDYNNCFWAYILFNSRPHTLSEIANLLDISISAVTNIEKRAIAKLKKKLTKEIK